MRTLGIVVFLMTGGLTPSVGAPPDWPSLKLEALIKKLESNDPEIRQRAAKELFERKQLPEEDTPLIPKAITRLAGLLEDKDETTRIYAAGAISAWGPGDVDAIRPLKKALEDQSSSVRGNSANALAKYGPLAKEATDPLKGLLADAMPAVRASAAHALYRVARNTKDTIPVLQACARDEDEFVRHNAAVSISGIVADDPKRINLLIDDLESAHNDVRTIMLGRLKSMKSDAKQAIPKLRKLLADKNELIRVDTASALWSIEKSTEAIEPVLKKLMESGNDEVCERTMQLFVSMGKHARNSARTATRFLKSDKARMRALAAHVLWRCTREVDEVFPIVIGELVDPKLDTTSKVESNLYYFGISDFKGVHQERANDLLVPYFGAKDVEMRRRAVGNVDTYLTEKLSKRTRDALEKALEDSDEKVRRSAALALARCGGELAQKAVSEIRKMLMYSKPVDMFTLHTPLQILSERAMPEATPELIELLKSKLANQDVWLKYFLSALAAIGPAAKDAMADLEKLLEHRKGEVRLSVARTLTRIDPKNAKAIAVLEEQTKGGDALLRVQAARALADIDPKNVLAVKTLKGFLSDQQTVAVAAAGELAELRLETDSVRAFALKSTESGDREDTIRGLGILRTLGKQDLEVITRVAKFLKHKTSSVRLAAAETLLEWKACEDEAIGAIVDVARLELDSEEEVRDAQSAIVLLARFPKDEDRVIKILELALWDHNDWVRRDAALALKKINPEAAKRLGVK